MGTRTEVVVWDGEAMVVLYRHFDGYPEFMLYLFKEGGKWAAWMCKDQHHWLSRAEDVAAYLIAYDGREEEKFREEKNFGTKPDLRPCVWVEDLIEYVYILDVREGRRGRWRVHVFEVNSSFWGVPRRKRDSLYRKIARRKSVEKIDAKGYLTYLKTEVIDWGVKPVVPTISNE
jgi:hypothetical protein